MPRGAEVGQVWLHALWDTPAPLTSATSWPAGPAATPTLASTRGSKRRLSPSGQPQVAQGREILSALLAAPPAWAEAALGAFTSSLSPAAFHLATAALTPSLLESHQQGCP